MAQPGRCVGRGLEHCLGSLAQIGKGHEFKSRPGLHDSSTPVLVTLLFDFSGDGLNRRLGSILVFHERAIPRAFFGETPVVAQLAIGIEQLILFITKARIIVAHFGKMGAGGRLLILAIWEAEWWICEIQVSLLENSAAYPNVIVKRHSVPSGPDADARLACLLHTRTTKAPAVRIESVTGTIDRRWASSPSLSIDTMLPPTLDDCTTTVVKAKWDLGPFVAVMLTS